MIKFLVQRPVGVIMSFLLLCVLGVVASFQIPTALLPSADIPVVEVHIRNPGYTPESFEETVVAQFRGNLSQTSSLKAIYSRAEASTAVVELTFEYGINMTEVFYEVNERVDEILSSLPLPLERPRVLKHKVTELPSLYLAVQWKQGSERPLIELSAIADKIIRRQLEQRPEISFVDESGLARTNIEMSVETNRLASLGLTSRQLLEALRQHQEKPGSIQVTDGHFTYRLSLESGLDNIGDLQRILIPLKERYITIGELAIFRQVVSTPAPYYHNQRVGISLALIKSAKYRETDFLNSVKQVVEEVQQRYPDLQVTQAKSNAVILSSLLSDLVSSLLWGLLFAVLVTLVFLRSFRNAMLILLCVAVSLLLDFLFFHALGMSVNIVSISGLILGIGLMIDNMIIVLDNIEQNIWSAGSVTAGTVSGVNELITSFISSTLTTCGVFVPLLFLSGLAGLLFFDQAMAVTAALLSSFVVSMFLLPVLYPLFHRRVPTPRPEPMLYPLYAAGKVWFDRHSRAIGWILAAVMIAGSVAFLAIEKEQLPRLSSSELVLKVDWGQRYSERDLAAHSQRIVSTFSEKLKASEMYLHHSEFLSMTQRGEVEDSQTLFFLQLNSSTDRLHVENEVHHWMKAHYPTAIVQVLPEESALNATLVNEEYNMKVISHTPGVTAIKMEEGLKQILPDLVATQVGTERTIQVTFRQDRLLRYGIEREVLIDFIRQQTSGTQVVSIPLAGEKVPVLLLSGDHQLASMLTSRFPAAEGKSYALDNLLEITAVEKGKAVEATAAGPCEILYVKTDDAPGIMAQAGNLFAGAAISFEGTFQQTRQLKREIAFILIITIVLLYLILAIQFESLKLPIIILTEIPIDFGFALLVLYLCGQTLNVMSFIGMVIMCGIVINDSILKIELIDQLRRAGTPVDEAIAIAGKRRLNAILMTTLSTLLAVVPTLFQNDLSAQLQSPLIIALVSGLVCGTPVSIYVIPLLYKRLIQ